MVRSLRFLTYSTRVVAIKAHHQISLWTTPASIPTGATIGFATIFGTWIVASWATLLPFFERKGHPGPLRPPRPRPSRARDAFCCRPGRHVVQHRNHVGIRMQTRPEMAAAASAISARYRAKNSSLAGLRCRDNLLWGRQRMTVCPSTVPATPAAGSNIQKLRSYAGTLLPAHPPAFRRGIGYGVKGNN
jgi:hypothetical protein